MVILTLSKNVLTDICFLISAKRGSFIKQISSSSNGTTKKNLNRKSSNNIVHEKIPNHNDLSLMSVDDISTSVEYDRVDHQTSEFTSRVFLNFSKNPFSEK